MMNALSTRPQQHCLLPELPALLSQPHIERTYWRGMTIYKLEDPATHIYSVVSGRIKTVRASTDGYNKIISICYRGDLFGELALGGGAVEARRSDEAVAMETSRVAIYRTEDFWRVTRHDPAAMQSVLRCLAARFSEAHRQIEILVFDNNRRRLARALLDLSGEAARVGETSVRLTHEELAELIGSTREVVTGMMIELRQRGLVEYKRGEIRPQLTRLAQFLAGEESLPQRAL